MAVPKEDWSSWVETHADQLMGGHPDTEESRAFRRRVVTEMKNLKIGNNLKGAEIVELGYEAGDPQFIFAYCAATCPDKAKGEVHAVLSGFGKKWKEDEGHALDKPFWAGRIQDIRSYLKYGALEQIHQELPRPTHPRPLTPSYYEDQRVSRGEGDVRGGLLPTGHPNWS